MTSNTPASFSPEARTEARPRDELLVADAEQPSPTDGLALDDEPEDRPGDGDRREHRDEHADDQHEREAADDRRAEPIEDERGDQARNVRVEDRVPGPVEPGLDRQRQALAQPQLLLRPLEDEDVRVDRHAD